MAEAKEATTMPEELGLFFFKECKFMVVDDQNHKVIEDKKERWSDGVFGSYLKEPD